MRRRPHTKEDRETALARLARNVAAVTPKSLGKHGRRRTARERRIAEQRMAQSARRAAVHYWRELMSRPGCLLEPVPVRVRIVHKRPPPPCYLDDTPPAAVLSPLPVPSWRR